MERIGRRKVWIDVVKGVGIFLMVIGHTGMSVRGFSFRWLIYGFHMPLFFMVAGYLHNDEKWNKLGMKRYLASRGQSYVIPYFILSIANLFICIIEHLIKRGRVGLLRQVEIWIWGIIWSYGDAQHTPNCTPLWFLIGLFVAEIMFIILLNLEKEWMRIGCYMLCFIVAIKLSLFPNIQLPWNFDAALIGVIFIYIGYLVKRLNVLDKRKIIIILVGIIGVIAIIFNPDLKGIVSNKLGNPVMYYLGGTGVSIAFMRIIKDIARGGITELLDIFLG